MKVDMALLSGEAEAEVKPVPAPAAKIPVSDDTDSVDIDDGEEEEDGEDELDESSSHSKLKTFLLIAAMVGGFGLFVWNMTGLVNNMRLDSQGTANTNIVYEYNLEDFMGSSENGSVTIDVEDHEESEVSTDAVRDGPESDESGSTGLDDHMASETGGSGDAATASELEQELRDAKNHAALVEQELKNAEDMLDSSLAREAELQSEIDRLTGNN